MNSFFLKLPVRYLTRTVGRYISTSFSAASLNYNPTLDSITFSGITMEQIGLKILPSDCEPPLLLTAFQSALEEPQGSRKLRAKGTDLGNN